MKITSYSLIALILLAFGIVSCGSKKLSAENAETGIVDSNKQQELYVWVENARLHKTADLSAEVITEIKGGEKVILTGEASTNKIKVKLRGVEFEDVWVKIKTSDEKEGWIFKGMLTDDMEKALAMNDFLILPDHSIGKVKLGDNITEVEKIYGTEFVKTGDIYFPEGMSAKGIYLFKDSPQELQCVINEKTSIIETILIRQPSSPWTTKEGVKIGTKLEDLVKINGDPIRFTGFGWDYGGNVIDFGKGKLSEYEGRLGIELGEPDDINGLDEFMGDTECSTSNKKILGKGVKVVEISISVGAAI